MNSSGYRKKKPEKLYMWLKLRLAIGERLLPCTEFPKSARVALMGVRQKYQNTRFGPALAYMIINAVMDAGKAKGLERVEMSWILDHNHGVRNIIESIGGQITKRYRMYEKELQ